jgi:hypothetical protein
MNESETVWSIFYLFLVLVLPPPLLTLPFILLFPLFLFPTFS